jgi:transcriptional regulator with XRE-family HTH domain
MTSTDGRAVTETVGIDRLISENLRRLRASAGLTQPQVAAHLGISYQAYQKIESGKSVFRVGTLCSLGVLYDVPITTFVDGVAELESPFLSRAIRILRGMDKDRQEDAIRAILMVKHGGSK